MAKKPNYVKPLDRISDLPDVLVALILSFLPTKQAVSTMVLSKRWERIWAEVPALDLNATGLANELESSFSDRVLSLNLAPWLRLFKLRCSETRQVQKFHIHSCIMNAMRRGVIEMDLLFDFAKTGWWMLLPEIVFVNENLEVLKLYSWLVPSTLTIHLPNLLTLHLHHLEFLDKSMLDYLLSRLPCLEELLIEQCTQFPTLRVCSSSLKRLSIINVVHYPFNNSLVYIQRKMIIDAPGLEYLRIKDVISAYEFGIMPSLSEVRYEIRQTHDFFDKRVISFLSSVSNLKTLNIAATAMVYVPEEIKLDKQLSGLFPNLTRLILRPGFQFRKPSNFWWHLVVSILHHAPKVVCFDYWCRGDCLNKFEEDQLHLPVFSSNNVKFDLIPTLKVVNIHLFEGEKSDIVVMKYLLKNATVLEEFRIHLKGVIDSRTRDVLSRLFQAPKVSSACEISIYQQNDFISALSWTDCLDSDESEGIGYGLVLQKDNPSSKTKSVAETELVTIREGLGFAKDLGIMKLQIETDAEANCLA